MKSMRQLTAIIEREDDAYVAPCPELDIVSQGDTVEGASHDFDAADANVVTEILTLAEGQLSEEALAAWTGEHSTKRR